MTDPLAPSDLAPVRHPAGPPPEVSREALLAAVRACVTIVAPGETLAVRVPPEWAADLRLTARLRVLADQLYRDTGVRAVFFAAEEFAVIRPKEELSCWSR